MHKRDYFLKALKGEAYRYKRWGIDAFSIIRPTEYDAEKIPFPYFLVYKEDGSYWFHNPEQNNELERIEGTTRGEPLFNLKQEIVLGVGDLPNVHRNLTTTYGNALVNQIILVYPFGSKVDFMEGEITIKRVEKIIEARLQDEPKPGAVKDPEALYVSEYMRFNEAALSLAGYTQLCVPSATPKTMTTDPQIKVRRKELLEQNKDRLHDPVVQAKIDAELVAMDRAWLKGDLGEGFYINDKSFNVVRKKTFLMQGASEGFGVQGDLIENSLNDGWDIEKLPAMSNSLRDGSYSRGAETMLGGEATKFNYRIFQNTIVSQDDCGTTMGLPMLLREDLAKFHLARSVVTPKGPVELTEENLGQYIGKKVLLRSPIYCKTGGANFCGTCIGKRIASTPQALSTYAADVGSIFMLISMKKMHGSSLSTARYRLTESIR